uniref:Uncharacterized protein n=1 Tax=Seriola dumerili TaxID=41447 RepID=A0A3B4U0M5_SERDU
MQSQYNVHVQFRLCNILLRIWCHHIYDTRNKLTKNKDEIKRLTHKPNDEQFAQKQEEICHFIQDEGISEAALQTAQQELCKLILGSYGKTTNVKYTPTHTHTHTHTPERSPEGRKHWEGRHVIWLDKGPVVRSKGPGQSHLSQTDDKVGTPEEEEDVVELQADQVFVVNCLSSVEGKKALGVGALRLHWTAREVLSFYEYREHIVITFKVY